MTATPPESSAQDPAIASEVSATAVAGIEVISDGGVEWHLDTSFLQSNWSCIWGRGCQGILDHPAEELGQGCCSVGAELVDDEPATTAMLAGYLDPEFFQFHEEANRGGIFSDSTQTNTRVIDGACIFLNRPGFVGGAGCALHLAAQKADESALDWKPSVCWQLPVRVQWEMQESGVEIAHVRAWKRSDWGDDGDTMAWCCTEEPEAYVGDSPVIESLAEELQEILGTAVFVEIQRRLSPPDVHL